MTMTSATDGTTTDSSAAAAAAAAERKQKRLEAWRKRQQQQQGKEEEEAGTTTSTNKIVVVANANAVSASASGTGGFQTTSLSSTTISSTPKSIIGEKPKLKIGLEKAKINKGRKKRKNTNNVARPPPGAIVDDGDDGDKDGEDGASRKSRAGLLNMEELNGVGGSSPAIIAAPPVIQLQQESVVGNNGDAKQQQSDADADLPSKRRRRGRWDVKGINEQESNSGALESSNVMANSTADEGMNDALDAFMMRLETGDDNDTMGEQQQSQSTTFIDSSGSTMVRMARTSIKAAADIRAISNVDSTTTAEMSVNNATTAMATTNAADWLLDVPATPYGSSIHPPDHDTNMEPETDDEEEERARRAFIDALKQSAPPTPSMDDVLASTDATNKNDDDYETRSEFKSEKERREDAVKQLSLEAERIRKQAHVAIDVGRLFNEDEGGVVDEAERTLAALTATPDALEVLQELNKKKELRAVDHKSIDYLPVRKNLYIVPQSLAKLTPAEVAERRAKLGVKVRGKGAPAPVSKFSEAGLSERIMSVLADKNIVDPFPVQAQCLPCIMAGRDVIGIAKTGSGKTLAFVLPMLRHILDQPPLGNNETGPIGLILAPARELAYQIHVVCKGLAKHLGLKSTAVYGGAGVAEQIGDLKRGTHILCATPGRLIDILTMQSGKLISLQRVSMVCLDECDRSFDMGFEPQIAAILSAVRPDRQTVLFSATFPKAVENLAKKSLRHPLEIIVGGRSVASDSVDQFAEVVEEEDKFLRLLQILGEHAENDKKVIVFVARQEQADSLFEQLTRCGYSSLSIHGGMDQEDRDSNMYDFKRADGPNVLVATSVAGRGLDVPSCGCVVNYSAPNHLEDYVHRVGRTGRGSARGVAFTFVNSIDEAKFAPSVVRAMVEAGQSKNVSEELNALAESFKEKVAKGEARWASSGYKGRGYTYDSSEISDVQKLAQMEKRQALIDAGLLDPDDEDVKDQDQDDNDDSGDAGATTTGPSSSGIGKKDAVGFLANVSADVLAIPGLREALMKKAGMLPTDVGPTSTSENHFVEELEINDYPQQARWKVTQKETTSRLQDEFQTAVTLKGQYVEPGKSPAEGERKLYLHLEAQSSQILLNCIAEIKRLLNEETLRVGARSVGGGGGRYSVM